MITRRHFLKLSLTTIAALTTSSTFSVCKVLASDCYDCDKIDKEYFVSGISSDCLSCGACLQVCQDNAIKADSDGNYSIDMELCSHCGNCIRICIVDAIEYERTDEYVSHNKDNDDDGLTNQQECTFGSSPCSKDTDRDGLNDQVEYIIKSNPRNSDTDNDGYSDYLEHDAGSDVNDPKSKPNSAIRYTYDGLNRIIKIVRK